MMLNTDCKKSLEHSAWLYDFLSSVQLSSFYNLFAYKLQVTEIFHFDYVSVQDLRKIGLSYPSIFRLIDGLKAYRANFGLPQSTAPLYLFQNSHRSKSFNLIRKIFHNRKSSQTYQTSNIVRNGDEDSTFYTKPEPLKNDQIFLLKLSDIQMEDKLGSGHSSVVYRGNWTNPIHRQIMPVAVKVMRAEIKDAKQISNISDLLNEFRAMQMLSHSNLLKLFGVVLSDQIMIVTELAPLGSLLRLLRANASSSIDQSKNCFTIDSLWDICQQIANGMDHLAEMNFIHRDLAARNVFVFSIYKKNYPLVKIGDFGLARHLDDQVELKEKEVCLDREELPSEMFDGVYNGKISTPIPIAWTSIEGLESNLFSQASDIWSWAVVAWEIWTFGAKPWPELNANSLCHKLRTGHRLPWPKLNCPRSIYQLMLACWHLDSEMRPTFSYLSHRLEKIKPIGCIAKENFDESDRLGVERNDYIIIFDAPKKSSWWRGQNKRTGEIGSLPNHLLEVVDGNGKEYYEIRGDSRSNSKDADLYFNLDVIESSYKSHGNDATDEDFYDERNILKISKQTIGEQRRRRQLTKTKSPSEFTRLPNDYSSTYCSAGTAPTGPQEDYLISDLKNNATKFKVGGLRDPNFPLHMPSGVIGSHNDLLPSAPTEEHLTGLRNRRHSIEDIFQPSAPMYESESDLFDLIYNAQIIDPPQTNIKADAQSLYSSGSLNLYSRDEFDFFNRNATTGGDKVFQHFTPLIPQKSDYHFSSKSAQQRQTSSSMSDFDRVFTNPFHEANLSENQKKDCNRNKLTRLEEIFFDPLDLKAEIEMISAKFTPHVTISEDTIRAALLKVLSQPHNHLGPFIPRPVPLDPSVNDPLIKQWRIEAVTRLLKLDRLESLLILGRQECGEILNSFHWDLKKSNDQVIKKKG